MRLSFKAAAIWILIAVVSGVVAQFLFDVSFWIGAVVGLFSLAVNGLIIEWEDRQPGGWCE